MSLFSHLLFPNFGIGTLMLSILRLSF